MTHGDLLSLFASGLVGALIAGAAATLWRGESGRVKALSKANLSLTGDLAATQAALERERIWRRASDSFISHSSWEESAPPGELLSFYRRERAASELPSKRV
jgi:hypothetical protein